MDPRSCTKISHEHFANSAPNFTAVKNAKFGLHFAPMVFETLWFRSEAKHLNSKTFYHPSPNFYSKTITVNSFTVAKLMTCVDPPVPCIERWAAGFARRHGRPLSRLRFAPADFSCLHVFTKCCQPGLLWQASSSPTTSWCPIYCAVSWAFWCHSRSCPANRNLLSPRPTMSL